MKKQIKIYDSGDLRFIIGDLNILDRHSFTINGKHYLVTPSSTEEIINEIKSKLPTPELKPGIYSEDVKVLVWDGSEEDIDNGKERYLLSIFRERGPLNNICEVWKDGENGYCKDFDTHNASRYGHFKPLPTYTIKEDGAETVIEWEE